MRSLVFVCYAIAFPFAAPVAQGPARNSRIVGVVSDSVNRAPLCGAEVIVAGVAASTTTDSLGRFTIDSLTPGTYQVGVFHPILESLGVTLATKPFVIGPDSAGVVKLSVPSVATLVRRYCGAEQSGWTPSAVAGQVLDPDTDGPIAGAHVSLEWTDVTVSKKTGVVRKPHKVHTETSRSGFFKVCALPANLNGRLQVTHGDASTPEVPIAMNGALLAFQSMSIPAKAATRATGVVRGHVRTLGGKPIPGARVEIPVSGVSTVTRDDGTFHLDDVFTGTQLIIVHSPSFELAAEPIIVTSRQPFELAVKLGPKVKLPDPVVR